MTQHKCSTMASLSGLVFRASRTLLRSTRGWQVTSLSQQAVACSPVHSKLWFSTEPKFDKEYFEKLVKDKPLVLFMKGEPSAPMCGFSRLVVQILTMHGLNDYPSYNVLEDMDFKEGMKEYSNWPTFPQVYMDGELVGGADIMLQLHQNGDLITELEKIGHKSALLSEPHPEQS